MKFFYCVIIFQLLPLVKSSSSFAQAHNTNPKIIAQKIKKENPDLIVPDSAKFFQKGYRHLTGKIGNSNATIEINSTLRIITAYVYSDSLQTIAGFNGNYHNGIFTFYFDDYIFGMNEWRLSSFILCIKKDSSFAGYFTCDSLQKIACCSFKEDYSNGVMQMNKLSFKYTNKYKNFPVQLATNILFADSSIKTGKLINNSLFDSYELIGNNYGDDIINLNFSSLSDLRNLATYKEYAKQKFIMCYKKIITTEFLKDAKESGHTDIYLNSLHSQIICNDGMYLILEIIMDYADGNAYPYYDTFIFEFDLKKQNEISDDLFANNLNINDSTTKEVIRNLQTVNRYDSTNDIDSWFFEEPEIAFVMKDGIVFVRHGGNHGIHSFYRYIPNELLKPYFKLR